MVLAGPIGATASVQTLRRVDLELVLAVDCSLSIDDGEYRLQTEGIASAFDHPAVLRAIAGGETGAIAVAYVEWAGPREHRLSIPWTLIDGEAAAHRFADLVRRISRAFRGDATSIGAAIDFCRPLFESSRMRAARRVIDISSDGTNNAGRFPAGARDDTVADGIIINALPILSDIGGLDGYFREEVIGGTGAFVLPALDFDTFGHAIRAKLIREIS